MPPNALSLSAAAASSGAISHSSASPGLRRCPPPIPSVPGHSASLKHGPFSELVPCSLSLLPIKLDYLHVTWQARVRLWVVTCAPEGRMQQPSDDLPQRRGPNRRFAPGPAQAGDGGRRVRQQFYCRGGGAPPVKAEGGSRRSGRGRKRSGPGGRGGTPTFPQGCAAAGATAVPTASSRGRPRSRGCV